ncbi:hypothetical protein [Sandaracinus amylolyticus]|uniref:hypothetical protein n=1 Tax=Sandaracinus amylolyticus TaxID=927083 RepID=UPI001F4648DD|nr:hypothetical protein [Sandaracinus amylolyticus]UJR78856.1 Hypothetical protein I5071_8890 [Sandaracinus amylolyticus]
MQPKDPPVWRVALWALGTCVVVGLSMLRAMTPAADERAELERGLARGLGIEGEDGASRVTEIARRELAPLLRDPRFRATTTLASRPRRDADGAGGVEEAPLADLGAQMLRGGIARAEPELITEHRAVRARLFELSPTACAAAWRGTPVAIGTALLRASDDEIATYWRTTRQLVERELDGERPRVIEDDETDAIVAEGVDAVLARGGAEALQRAIDETDASDEVACAGMRALHEALPTLDASLADRLARALLVR